MSRLGSLGGVAAISGERPNGGRLLQPITDSTADDESRIRLEALLFEGLQSGEPIPVNREFWQRLRAEAQQLVEAGTDRRTVAKP